MSFKKKDDKELPSAKGSQKKSNLAKDEKIKNFWDTLVKDWLKMSAKPREKDKSEG